RKANEASLALQIRYGNVELLFMGDTEEQGEELMLPYENLLPSEILQVGHHGSLTSSSMPFLKYVKPHYAVISMGPFNRFQHPSFEVTSRLAALGSDTLRTDLSGGQIFTTDGRTIEQAN
ncbi:MAG: ComEC/Rec2 family competence protein, partial [bacterium]